jgi:tetratricopeptide (TPR) repeat protein
MTKHTAISSSLDFSSEVSTEVSRLLSEAYALRNSDARKALALAETALAESETHQFTHGIARSHCIGGICRYLLNDYTESLRSLRAAEPLFRELKDDIGIADCHKWTAAVLTRQGHLAEALHEANQELALRRRVSEPVALAMSLNQLGMIYAHQGRYAESLAPLTEALALLEGCGATEKMVSLYSTISMVYTGLNDQPNALTYSTACLALAVETKNLRWQQIAHHNLGLRHTEQNQHDNALAHFLESLSIGNTLTDERLMASTRIQIAALCIRANEFQLAEDHLFAAVQTLKTIGDKRTLCMAYSELAHLYDKQGELEDAVFYTETALELELELGATDFIYESERKLAEYYDALGITAQADRHRQKAIALRRERFSTAAIEKEKAARHTLESFTNNPDYALPHLSPAMTLSETQRQKISDSLSTSTNTPNAPTIDARRSPVYIDALNAKAWQLRNTNLQDMLRLGNEASELAASIDYDFGEAMGLRNMAAALILSSDFPQAIDTATRAMAKLAGVDAPVEKSSVLQIKAGAYQRLGKHDDAIIFYNAALEYAQTSPEAESVIRSNMGTVYLQTGNFTEAVSNLLRGVSLIQSLPAGKTKRAGLPMALTNLGMACFHLHDFPNALRYLHESLALAKQHSNRRAEITAEVNLGLVYYAQHDYVRALQASLHAATLKEELGDINGQSRLFNTIGLISRAVGDAAAAHHYFQKSLTLARAHKEVETECAVRINLGALYLHENQIADAESELLSAAALALRTDTKAFLYESSNTLAALYHKTGDTTRETHFKNAAAEVRADVFNRDALRSARELIIQFESAQHTLPANADDHMLVQSILQKAIAHQSVDSSTLAATPRINDIGDFGSVENLLESLHTRKSITVKTFGGFEVCIEGRVISQDEWQRKKARDVFKYLLMKHGNAVTVSEILDALWNEHRSDGGRNESNAQMVLQKAVSYIRKALEPTLEARKPSRYLSFTDNAYTLNLGSDAFIDFVVFKSLMAAAQKSGQIADRLKLYEEAVRLYTGEFLSPDVYEPWTSFERERLKDSYLLALQGLARAAESENDVSKALQHAYAILACDRTDETAYRIALSALITANRHAEAGKLSQSCIDAFKTELDSAPPKSLRALIYR